VSEPGDGCAFEIGHVGVHFLRELWSHFPVLDA
jgi:hypothetical protein